SGFIQVSYFLLQLNYCIRCLNTFQLLYRFELNFKTGPSENDDIAFHFNARMDRKVVMNSFRNRGWEAEESVSDNPFKKGQPFEMFIVVKSEGYVVYVNGKELYTFKHRIPLEKVSMLNIKVLRPVQNLVSN
uniref:Galectin n=1 Tax=Sinocyclocheilus rhinocerous TaxID=307959 RepID=A0A673N1J1_9TELE